MVELIILITFFLCILGAAYFNAKEDIGEEIWFIGMAIIFSNFLID